LVAAAHMKTLLAVAAALVLTPTSASPATAAHPFVRHAEIDRLYRLFRRSDSEFVRRNPLEAVLRSEAGAHGNFGDYITDSYFAEEKRAAERDLATLRSIDRTVLSPEAQVAYDAFQWQRRSDLEGSQPWLRALTKFQPLEQVYGFTALMPRISAGSSVIRFATAADYDANLRRLWGYALYLDRARQRLRKGLAAHVTEPQVVMRHIADQLDEVIAKGVDESPFFAPVKSMARAIPAAECRRIAHEYRSMLSDRLLPAQRALSEFIRHDYIPKARTQPGLSALPGGGRLYAHLVGQFTTTDMSPEQIHELGLSEVGRIELAMDQVRRKVGFDGTLAAFAQHMRTDPRFAPQSAEQLSELYRSIQAKVESQLPQHFGRLPRAKLVVMPLSGIGAASAPNASYSQGPPDGSRPGVFHFNVSDLPSRRTFYTESLFLHEGEPGHHLQDNLASENEDLPAFLRFEGTAAFGEGWAVYTEGLGPEFGLYSDPYQLYGRYTNELFRAARLVVDTGIHAFGWSRHQAIDYLIAHTALSRTVIEQEVDRYIADPGQALAYKIGELRILELRRRAEQRLGSRFDERAFHDMVLEDGRIPLAVLDRKGDRWIAAQRDK
jgi:uncharacterized protein (DUF885 family)